MARDVHPDIKRALGAGDLHTSAADRALDRADRFLDEAEGKPRKKEPSLTDIHEELGKLRGDWEEDSKVIRDLANRKSDAAALSMSGPAGFHLSARGRVVWLVAILAGVVALAWIAGRATAAHRAHGTETTQPK